MSDYAEHLVTIERALVDLQGLLPDGKVWIAKEKAILIEQAARAIAEHCKQRDHALALEAIARRHPNMQVLSPESAEHRKMVYAHITARE